MRSTSSVFLVMSVVLLTLGACGFRHEVPLPPAVVLMYPPEIQDATAPGGIRLVPESPGADWRLAGQFASVAECQAWKADETARTIEAARAALGDDARFDLGVRRAVNARCVASGTP